MPETPGTVIGFVSAWILFELTELRRRRVQANNIRQSLMAEMKSVERVLSAEVFNLSVAVGDTAPAVTEMRWLLGQKEALDLLREEPVSLLEKSDQEVATVLQLLKSKAAKDVPDLPTPILNAAFSAQAFGFSPEEIQILGEINRYIQGFAHHGRSMREYIRFSFTVTDPENHAIVKQNYDSNLRSCRLCAIDALRHVRTAIQTVTPLPSWQPVLKRFYSAIQHHFIRWITRLRAWVK